MAAKLTDDSYGKTNVRLTKVTRLPDRHELKELTVDVQLTGDFSETYLTGDNSKIVATDSMKNTVYVLAKQHPIDSLEAFGGHLAAHFLTSYPQVAGARVTMGQHAWHRIKKDGSPHPYAFIAGSDERRTCLVTGDKKGIAYHAGVERLMVLKTTDSAFTGYVRDKFTTLPETSDRILATSVTADWYYIPARGGEDWNDRFDKVRRTLLDVFADHMSLSVQQTLFAMGRAVIDSCDYVRKISVTMPNKHRIPFNFAPFGTKFENDIFVPTDEPSGMIRGTIERD